MILASLVVGAVTVYWFGLRAGLWAAAATFALCFAALFFPRYALGIYVIVALAVVGIFLVGSRRPRPPDAVVATRWIRRTVGHGASLLRSFLAQRKDRREQDRKNDRKNGRS